MHHTVADLTGKLEQYRKALSNLACDIASLQGATARLLAEIEAVCVTETDHASEPLTVFAPAIGEIDGWDDQDATLEPEAGLDNADIEALEDLEDNSEPETGALSLDAQDVAAGDDVLAGDALGDDDLAEIEVFGAGEEETNAVAEDADIDVDAAGVDPVCSDVATTAATAAAETSACSLTEAVAIDVSEALQALRLDEHVTGQTSCEATGQSEAPVPACVADADPANRADNTPEVAKIVGATDEIVPDAVVMTTPEATAIPAANVIDLASHRKARGSVLRRVMTAAAAVALVVGAATTMLPNILAGDLAVHLLSLTACDVTALAGSKDCAILAWLSL